jgi:glutamyl-Q tRNA(Asp) synthetase
MRLRVPDIEICFQDRLFGRRCQQLAREVGDFIIRRADGFFAYQLAVVVDDFDQAINQVVRGADLLLSTPRQILLQRLIGAPPVRYLHLPLVVDASGRKLSKRDQAHPVDDRRPLEGLLAAWRFLGQRVPDSRPQGVEEFWRWAEIYWNPDLIPLRVVR